MIHKISTGRLTLERLKEIIDNHATLVLSDEATAAILKCRRYLDRKMEDPSKPVYGITTGFGSLYNATTPADELSQLQHNLVVSHACGAGETVRPEIVKLMLFLKAQSLSYGHSGAQLITVQRLIDMFNEDILPIVYQQGSLGASGDLAPLAHLRTRVASPWSPVSADLAQAKAPITPSPRHRGQCPLWHAERVRGSILVSIMPPSASV